MKVRKKPVLVDAVKFVGFDSPEGNFTERPKWLLDSIDDGTVEFFDKENKLTIVTLEGPIYASPGDYIIRGVDGELYPCKPDIFTRTYDEVVFDGEDNY